MTVTGPTSPPRSTELPTGLTGPRTPRSRTNLAPVQWKISAQPVDYEDAIAFMEARVAAIRAGHAPELVWLLEHPPLYTAGTSAKPQDLLNPSRFRVYTTGRGGQYTYHGPGQRVIYVLLDVKARGRDVRAFVTQLEHWLIDVLAAFDIAAAAHADRVGVWVERPVSLDTSTLTPMAASRQDKIGAIGIRLRKWVSYHGMALNVSPCLEHFSGIVPCGITGHGLTSMHDLGKHVSLAQVDDVIRRVFEQRFDTATYKD